MTFSQNSIFLIDQNKISIPNIQNFGLVLAAWTNLEILTLSERTFFKKLFAICAYASTPTPTKVVSNWLKTFRIEWAYGNIRWFYAKKFRGVEIILNYMVKHQSYWIACIDQWSLGQPVNGQISSDCTLRWCTVCQINPRLGLCHFLQKEWNNMPLNVGLYRDYNMSDWINSVLSPNCIFDCSWPVSKTKWGNNKSSASKYFFYRIYCRSW